MQRKTNEGTTEAIDTEKKQYDGNLQTSSSSKKVDKDQPIKILTRKAQQATNVPPVAEIKIDQDPDERFDFDFDAYDDDLQLHPVLANCIRKIWYKVSTSLVSKDLYDAAGNIIIWANSVHRESQFAISDSGADSCVLGNQVTVILTLAEMLES